MALSSVLIEVNHGWTIIVTCKENAMNSCERTTIELRDKPVTGEETVKPARKWISY